jgi:hypothetical protein
MAIHNSMLKGYMDNIRRLHDRALLLSGKYRGFNDVTIKRYQVRETEMKDEYKVLLQVIKNVSVYIDFPSNVSTFNTNAPFVEDVLPIIALVPWKHGCKILKVDIGDELEFTNIDEFGHELVHTYVITDRQTMWEQYFLYREFIIAPKRVDVVDTIGRGPNDQTGEEDSNITDYRANANSPLEIYSEYD